MGHLVAAERSNKCPAHLHSSFRVRFFFRIRDRNKQYNFWGTNNAWDTDSILPTYHGKFWEESLAWILLVPVLIVLWECRVLHSVWSLVPVERSWPGPQIKRCNSLNLYRLLLCYISINELSCKAAVRENYLRYIAVSKILACHLIWTQRWSKAYISTDSLVVMNDCRKWSIHQSIKEISQCPKDTCIR